VDAQLFPSDGAVLPRTLLVTLYTLWDQAEPGVGHAARAADWQRKIDASQPAATKP